MLFLTLTVVVKSTPCEENRTGDSTAEMPNCDWYLHICKSISARTSFCCTVIQLTYICGIFCYIAMCFFYFIPFARSFPLFDFDEFSTRLFVSLGFDANVRRRRWNAELLPSDCKPLWWTAKTKLLILLEYVLAVFFAPSFHHSIARALYTSVERTIQNV